MPIVAAIGGAVAGSAVSGLFSSHSASQQMNFQERMSGTAHRREVEDLKAAGLNPILSAKYGGASTPQGAGYQVPDIGSNISGAISSASQAKRVDTEVDNIRADTDKKITENDKLAVEMLKLTQEISTSKDLARTYREQARKHRIDADLQSVYSNFYRDNPDFINFEKTFGQGNAAAAVKGLQQLYGHKPQQGRKGRRGRNRRNK